jgi:hypothetical protein
MVATAVFPSDLGRILIATEMPAGISVHFAYTYAAKFAEYLQFAGIAFNRQEDVSFLLQNGSFLDMIFLYKCN